jgi:hypothetical protein
MACLVHLVSFVQPSKRDKPNEPNNDSLMLADFFSILLETLLLTPLSVNRIHVARDKREERDSRDGRGFEVIHLTTAHTSEKNSISHHTQ